MKKTVYKRTRTSVYNINYHIIWCTKYRRKVLTPDIENRLLEILQNVANEKDFTLVEARVGNSDHIHCFISAPPKLSVTSIARYLKGISGRLILKEHPELQKRVRKGHLWNDSYFVESIGSTSEENILRYIERQQNCQG